MARRRARRSSGYRPTGFEGIRELDTGRYEAEFQGGGQRLKQRFDTLDQARAWKAQVKRAHLASLPQILCANPNCPAPNRPFPKEHPNQKFCCQACMYEASRLQTAEANRRARAGRGMVRVERNIFSNYTQKFFVRVTIQGYTHAGEEDTLEAARALRDGLLRTQRRHHQKVCPECGRAFTAQRSDAVYCSREHGIQALRKGIVVKPARTKKAQARKRAAERKAAREVQT